MLPQKLGLDVVIEKSTDNIITIEINGENSGYQGLKDLGEDLSDRIINIIGTSLEGQTILVRSQALIEFIIQKDDVQKFKKLREDYGITLIFAPIISGKPSLKDLETAIG